MAHDYLIGLDFGSDTARGVLVDAASGRIEAQCVHAYAHGVLSDRLPGGTPLPPFFALQSAPDYREAAASLLGTLGRGRSIRGIGIDFTASSPLPTRADGTPLSQDCPDDPHAYVKLWKHQAAQPWADRITATGGAFLDPCGGRLSANSLTAKAAEMAEAAPALWAATDRFVEAGDWLVWQLTGVEARSMAFAAFKALYRPGAGYPEVVSGLSAKLTPPRPVGQAAGPLSTIWRERTGITGEAIVAVAVIDAHAVMPAVGAVRPGMLVGALGTSACYLLLDDAERPMPVGVEGVASDATLPDLRCFEAGQGGFGDTLAWFVRQFPHGGTHEAAFRHYNAAAAALRPGQSRLVALDWFNGNRVPHGDALLSGLLVGMTLQTSAVHIYRALMESLCFGARTIVDLLAGAGAPIDGVVMTSGLSLNNPVLMQIMADVLGRPIRVPQQEQLTALGAAIHGAVASHLVPDFAAGAARFGATDFLTYQPDPASTLVYDRLYAIYRSLGNSAAREAMQALARLPA